MRWRRRRWLVLGGLVLPLWAAGGCTNSDALNSGTGQLPVQVQLTNPTTRFATAGLSFAQVVIRPVDANASTVLGVNQLGILATTTAGIDLDFNGGQTEFTIGSTLPAGTYRLESLNLQKLLFMNGTQTSTGAGCVGVATSYTESAATIDLRAFGDLFITVPEEGSGGPARFTIDGGALALAFEQSWACGCVFFGRCEAGITTCGVAQRCGATFRASDFSARASTFLTFE